MNIDEKRVEDIFQELSIKLENVTVGELKRRAYSILEERAYLHESEERRAKEKLPIFLDELEQREVYKRIKINKTPIKAKSEAYTNAKQGIY